MGPGFFTGVAVGAGAMYFLDPQHGVHRRARARETYWRLRPTINAGVEAAEPAVRGLAGMVRGAAGRVPVRRVLRLAGRDARQPDGRPAVMANLTETQMEELIRQFGERDRQAWDALAASYGWTPEQGEEVWRWFEQRPQPGQPVHAA